MFIKKMFRISKYGNWTMPKSKRFLRKSWAEKPKPKPKPKKKKIK